MGKLFNPTEYKVKTKTNWNALASEYHQNWVIKHKGPFKATRQVVEMAGISKSDKVLDVGCGTGAVSHEVLRNLGKDGFLVGIDLSRNALSIAKSMQCTNANFLEMDAENIGLNLVFDKILCQYALMFFPDTRKVLQSVRKMLREGGRVVLSVHGNPEEVPYFSCIMNPILKYIPNIRPEGSPTVHRFGDEKCLREELSNARLHNITITKYVFQYTIGTFEEYWNAYMSTTANSIRPIVEKKGSDFVSIIKEESKRNTMSYSKNGKIVFPWTVLIASAE